MATIRRRKTRRRENRSTARNETPRGARIRGAGETDVGNHRDRNEDVFVVEQDLGLYAVLDGMGGRNAGDVAARMAADCIVDYVRQQVDNRQRRPPRQTLELAFEAATEALFFAGLQREERRGMGTTAVACLFVDPTRVVIAHVGDSRAYLLRDGELSQLTRDHSVVQELIEEGKLTPRSARRSPRRHAITRRLGHLSVRTDVQERTLQPGDRLLLCSDGLHGHTPERSIRRVLAASGTPAQIARDLVALALQGAAPDNVSVVVIVVAERPARVAIQRARPRREPGSSRERSASSRRIGTR